MGNIVIQIIVYIFPLSTFFLKHKFIAHQMAMEGPYEKVPTTVPIWLNQDISRRFLKSWIG